MYVHTSDDLQSTPRLWFSQWTVGIFMQANICRWSISEGRLPVFCPKNHHANIREGEKPEGRQLKPNPFGHWLRFRFAYIDDRSGEALRGINSAQISTPLGTTLRGCQATPALTVSNSSPSRPSSLSISPRPSSCPAPSFLSKQHFLQALLLNCHTMLRGEPRKRETLFVHYVE